MSRGQRAPSFPPRLERCKPSTLVIRTVTAKCGVSKGLMPSRPHLCILRLFPRSCMVRRRGAENLFPCAWYIHASSGQLWGLSFGQSLQLRLKILLTVLVDAASPDRPITLPRFPHLIHASVDIDVVRSGRGRCSPPDGLPCLKHEVAKHITGEDFSSPLGRYVRIK